MLKGFFLLIGGLTVVVLSTRALIQGWAEVRVRGSLDRQPFILEGTDARIYAGLGFVAGLAFVGYGLYLIKMDGRDDPPPWD